MSNIRILLCEDQTLVRHGLRTILELEPGMAVAGEAADGEEAVQRALELRPDIVLMDIQMPRRSGVEATALITAACLDAPAPQMPTQSCRHPPASIQATATARAAGAASLKIVSMPATPRRVAPAGCAMTGASMRE